MSRLQEQQLIEGLKNLFYGVQKSEQVYKNLSKWQKKALKLDDKEIEKAAKLIASRVDGWAVSQEASGNKPSPVEVKKKLAEELENFAK